MDIDFDDRDFDGSGDDSDGPNPLPTGYRTMITFIEFIDKLHKVLRSIRTRLTSVSLSAPHLFTPQTGSFAMWIQKLETLDRTLSNIRNSYVATDGNNIADHQSILEGEVELFVRELSTVISTLTGYNWLNHEDGIYLQGQLDEAYEELQKLRSLISKGKTSGFNEEIVRAVGPIIRQCNKNTKD